MSYSAILQYLTSASTSGDGNEVQHFAIFILDDSKKRAESIAFDSFLKTVAFLKLAFYFTANLSTYTSPDAVLTFTKYIPDGTDNSSRLVLFCEDTT